MSFRVIWIYKPLLIHFKHVHLAVTNPVLGCQNGPNCIECVLNRWWSMIFTVDLEISRKKMLQCSLVNNLGHLTPLDLDILRPLTVMSQYFSWRFLSILFWFKIRFSSLMPDTTPTVSWLNVHAGLKIRDQYGDHLGWLVDRGEFRRGRRWGTRGRKNESKRQTEKEEKNSMGKKTKRRKRAQQERTKEEDSRVE